MTGLLQNGLSALELAALPPADGAVICGEIGNVRTAQVRTLFAIGMNDMPGSGDNGLLTVQEQQATQEVSGAYLGMTPQESAALGQLDELKALSGARKESHFIRRGGRYGKDAARRRSRAGDPQIVSE